MILQVECAQGDAFLIEIPTNSLMRILFEKITKVVQKRQQAFTIFKMDEIKNENIFKEILSPDLLQKKAIINLEQLNTLLKPYELPTLLIKDAKLKMFGKYLEPVKDLKHYVGNNEKTRIKIEFESPSLQIIDFGKVTSFS